MTQTVKTRLTSAAPAALFGLLVIQPLLDVASYWANRFDVTFLTTGIRFVMLAAVVIYSFIISNNRRRSLAAYGVMAIFVILHCAACVAAGGYHIVSDLANCLRIIQLPVFTYCFIDVFEAAPEAKKRIPAALTVILLIIIAVVALSFAVGRPVYTYEEYSDGRFYGYGFQGWFEIGNAQSAVCVLIVPGVLYFALKKKNELLFTGLAALCMANLYFFGTRFAYYSIFIIAGGFLLTFAITRSKRVLPYIILLAICFLSFIFMKNSAMYLHQNHYRNVMEDRQEQTESEIRSIAKKYPNVKMDPSTLFEEDPSSTEPVTGDQSDRKQAQSELRNVYLSTYSLYCQDLIDHFGISRVVDMYDGSADAFTLSNVRLKKINFAKMSWEDSSAGCHLFGFQYSTLVTDKDVYDLENDFTGTFYFVGWIGMAMYVAFICYFVLRAAAYMIRDPKSAFTPEFCVVGITLIVIVLAAQFSGNVLRRPNVSVYFSLFLAWLWSITPGVFAKREKK